MDITTYALSKKIAAHALSGVQSMSVSGQTLTINTKDSGVLTMTFPTPKDGVSVTDIDVNANNQIVFTMSDGTEIISGKIPTVKGDKGDAGFSPTITENADNTDKIYKLDITTADSTFTTPNLKGADGQGGTGGGEENKIDSISVNGVNVAIDENKNVDITVPSIEGLTKDADLATVAKSGDYEDLINKPTIPDITGLATETYVDNKVADYTKTVDLADVAISGSYNDLADKPIIPSLDGYAKTSEIPSKVSELENDSNYLSSIPEEYVTETELNAKGYLTEHQDISNLVEKENGKGLSSNDYTTEEKNKLAGLENYNDTQINANITALSERVNDVETSIGDMSTIKVKSVSDLVSAINTLYDAFMSSITYANKKLTITYRNGGTVDIDMSAIITDTNIGELSNIDDTGVVDKQVLSYNAATNKYIPTTIDTAGVLADAKKYTDDEIAKINNADAMAVDEKPTYSNGTITYKKNGIEKTITDGDFWFFYTVNDMAYQTIWIDGIEFTTSVDGSVDFKDFVSKTNDLVSTYTGEEADKTKVTTIASLDALYAIISTALGKKVNMTDIVNSLISDATDKPLSAAQGKVLDTKISTVEKDYAKKTDLHSHNNKAVLDGITSTKISNWDSAKTHADSAHAPSNAQANVLETVKVNGTTLEVSNKAVNVTVPTTVAELTDSSSYAKKTDIPTTLPANGGNAATVNNHTVETNVPADAVFTDTVYNDSALVGRVKATEDTLKLKANGQNITFSVTPAGLLNVKKEA